MTYQHSIAYRVDENDITLEHQKELQMLILDFLESKGYKDVSSWRAGTYDSGFNEKWVRKDKLCKST